MILKIKNILSRILGMKLRYRMLLIYIVGGLVPMILTCIYLAYGTNQILIMQAKDNELNVLTIARLQMEETFNTVNTVSKYFYFDDKLENIAATQYEEYQDIIDDYWDYSAFTDYRSYYSRIIRWISVYIENDTLSNNARFVKVDDEIRQSDWYTRAVEMDGGAAWEYLYDSTGASQCLSLVRRLKTSKGEHVGVLVIQVLTDKLREVLIERDVSTYLLLNGETLIASNERTVNLEAVIEAMGETSAGEDCRNITFNGEDYVIGRVDIPFQEASDTLQIISLQASKEILREATEKNIRSALFIVGSVVISSILIGLFSRSYSSRVERFRLQMQKAAAGDFNLVGQIGGSDEISELYEYLSTMIYSIQNLLAQVYREQLQKEKLKTRQQEAEFKMLASQINPHFLYNTLETIRMKARKSKQPELEELVKMLAKILRRNIQAGSQQVTLNSEMELLKYYLKIQEYRFGDRIQFHFDEDETLNNLRIPPLLIQPIVENAIIHGLEEKEGQGNIWVRTKRGQDKLIIEVEDDGLGIPHDNLMAILYDLNESDELDRTHIGISNVHQRIRMLYGKNYGVSIKSKLGEGTKVEVTIPIK